MRIDSLQHTMDLQTQYISIKGWAWAEVELSAVSTENMAMEQAVTTMPQFTAEMILARVML